MVPSILDYHSDTPTFALAFSPLSTSTSTLKLGVGSFIDTRGDQNHLTIVGLDPTFLDLEDGWDDLNGLGVAMNDDGYNYPNFGGNGGVGGGGRVKPGTSAFVGLARTPHPYPPSAIAFSPATLSSSLQSSNVGTVGEGTREMVASSSDCLRLFDLVGDEGKAGGFVGGAGRREGGTRLVNRAVLANVSVSLYPLRNTRT